MQGLNPYSIGRYSVSKYTNVKLAELKCLNPYSIGRYSVRTSWPIVQGTEKQVLILILLEDTL